MFGVVIVGLIEATFKDGSSLAVATKSELHEWIDIDTPFEAYFVRMLSQIFHMRTIWSNYYLSHWGRICDSM